MSFKFEDSLKDLSATTVPRKSVRLTGNFDLDVPSVIFVSRGNAKVQISVSQEKKLLIETVVNKMLDQVRFGEPIYGTTTSYGERARLVLNKGDEAVRIRNATKLSEAVVHVDVSTGPKLPKEVVRAAMLIRINMLLSGASAVRLEILETIGKLLNEQITPLVGQYGSVGASGDLAQNGRILSCLLQNPYVFVATKSGKVSKASSALKKLGIDPVKLLPKEGLAIVNGDNFSSANCLLLSYETVKLILISLAVSSITIQALRGSDRNFHPFLAEVRPHMGQVFVASLFRKLLQNSKLARQEMMGHNAREDGESVQDPYSIRCLPQYYGSDIEALGQIWSTVKVNINSVSDNPLWVLPHSTVKHEDPFRWVSGGNFLAMHMSECVDRLRKVLVHIVKQNDRHLARLVHPQFNRGLSANLSDKNTVSQATFKGLQTQMGMYEAYSMLLTMPASTIFGSHEEYNQDITSQAPASSILGWELLRIAKLAVATNFIAACQAVDLRGGPDLLSPLTKPLYYLLRERIPYVKKEQPMGHFVEEVVAELLDNNEKLIKYLL